MVAASSSSNLFQPASNLIGWQIDLDQLMSTAGAAHEADARWGDAQGAREEADQLVVRAPVDRWGGKVDPEYLPVVGDNR
jgi:hypothetical protein